MSNKSNRLERLSKDEVKEAIDIIMNTEDDEAAIAFLQDTLTEDFPDMELGSMDLHEAIEVLGGSEARKVDLSEKKGNRTMIESLNESIGVFIDKQEKRLNNMKRDK